MTASHKKPAKPAETEPSAPPPGSAAEYLTFEILAEPWCRFRLEDGTTLRVRYILLKMLRAPGETTSGLKSASVSSQILVAVEPTSEQRGGPGPIPPPEEVAKHIDREVAFESVDVAPSVYRFEKDRTLVVTTSLIRVRRTTLFGPDGDRIYQVETGSQVAVMGGPVRPPTQPPTPVTAPG